MFTAFLQSLRKSPFHAPEAAERLLKQSGIRILLALIALIQPSGSIAEVQRIEGPKRILSQGTLRSYAISPSRRLIASVGSGGTSVWSLLNGKLLNTYPHEKDFLYHVAFTGDSKQIISVGTPQTIVWDIESGSIAQKLPGGGGRKVALSESGSAFMIRLAHEAQIWDTATGQLLASLPHPDIAALDINRPGDLAVTAGTNGNAVLWDLEAAHPIQTFDHSEPLFSASFSPDASRLVIGARAQIWIWDTASGKLIDHIEETRSGVLGIDNLSLAAKTIDRDAALWSTDPAAKLFDLQGSNAPLEDVAFSPQGDWTIGGGRKTIWFWDTASGALQHEISGHSSKFSPDGSLFLTRKDSGNFQLWESRPLGEIRTFTGHRSGRFFARYAPSGNQIATADAARITVYTHEGDFLTTLEGHEQSITSMTYSRDSKRLLSTAEDNQVNLWNPIEGTLIHSFNSDITPLLSVFTPPNSGVLFIKSDGTATFLESDFTESERQLEGHSSPITSVDIHPTENWIATGDESGTVVITDSDSKLEIRKLAVDEPISSLAFNPQVPQLFLGTRSGPSYLYDLTNGERIISIDTGPAWTATVSPNGRSVLIAGATLWDLNTGQERYSLSLDDRLGADANGTAFSPDGRFIAGTGSLFDASARIWNAASGELLYILDRHEGTATSIEFSPDSHSLLTSASGGRAMIWDVRSDPILQINQRDHQIEILWDNGTLESSISPLGPWNRLDDLSSPAKFPIAGSHLFFRTRSE